MHRPSNVPSPIRLAYGAVLCLTSLACMGRTTEITAYPLYPNPERQLASSEVAKLVTATNAPTSGAIIKAVDGRNVADQEAEAFALLPGCHVVQTTDNLVMASDTITWRGNPGPRVFPLKMKAGRTYVVRLDLIQGMDMSARISIHVEEQDMQGATTATFDAAKSIDEIKACQAWRSDVPATP